MTTILQQIEDPEVRRQLRSMRYAPPPGVARQTGTHELVVVGEGGVDAALRGLRKQLRHANVYGLIVKRDSALYSYTPPSAAKREKSARARARARKRATRGR